MNWRIISKIFMVVCLLITAFVGGTLITSTEAHQINQADYKAGGNSVLGQGNTNVSAITLVEVLNRAGAGNPASQSVHNRSRLDKIKEEEVIRVGTTGDYKPFTYFNEETQEYEGYDIEAAKLLARELDVEVEFVETTWSALMEDLLDDKFDIAMGGITRRMDRQVDAQFSNGYITFGKSPLIRAEDADRFTSLEDIDQADVTIGVNPGGTNQQFVNANIQHANVVVVENNLEIPGMVASGEVDVMITDSIEAIYYANRDERLYAPLTENPWDISQFGYMMQHGDPKFTNTINFWMEEMELKGEFEHLQNVWIY